MEGTIRRCDQCGYEEHKYDNTFGGLGRNWITVTRNESMSQDKIGAGKAHFCTEQCLRDRMAGEKGAEKPDPAAKFKASLQEVQKWR